MRGLLKIFVSILLIGILVCGVFVGRLFLMGNNLRKDLQELESYQFEVQYHINGDSDILNMAPYETSETPTITKWFVSYIKKMEQGGCVKGAMRDGVFHAEVYAEEESQSSIDFYYDEQAVFGVKKTLDYMIASMAKETKLPISLLQNVTPDGYVSLEQIKAILGVEANEDVEDSQINFMELGKELLGHLILFLPSSGEENYFQAQLEDVDMSYCMAKTNLNGQETNLTVGISNETYHKYVYLKIDDVAGKKDSDLEVLLHINVTENQQIVVPETISDDIIKTLASVIAFLNNFGK